MIFSPQLFVTIQGKAGETIDFLIALLTPLEMLLINLFVIDRCSEKKYSAAKTYLGLGAFGVLLFIFVYLLAPLIPDFGSGNGLYIFFGFLFAIPIKFLYNNTVAKIVCLACTSWVYTYFVFSLSVHISYLLLHSIPQTYSVFIIQSLLYVLSFMWFYKLLRYKYMVMLGQLDKRETISLMWVSIAWFWTAFVVNLVFLYPDIYLFRILAVASVALSAFNFYRYIYQVIHSGRTIQSLEQIAYHDSLTQLRTRALLSSDVNQLFERDIPFSLIFMDLNNFKHVNDTYGHVVGDEYLAFFAREVKALVGNSGGFYRVSGDEFVAILTDVPLASWTQKLDALPDTITSSDVPFLGVSYGAASYPADAKTLTDLMEIADKRMYTMKKKIPSISQAGAPV